MIVSAQTPAQAVRVDCEEVVRGLIEGFHGQFCLFTAPVQRKMSLIVHDEKWREMPKDITPFAPKAIIYAVLFLKSNQNKFPRSKINEKLFKIKKEKILPKNIPKV